jgi:predicted homoserine dehydrogenase-like protein
MIGKGLIANAAGTAMLIYRPYHLCGAETAMSILCAGLLGVPTGAAEILPRVDMTATAARDFRAGETLSGPGLMGWDRDFRASLVPAIKVMESSPAPFFMLEGRRLKVDVPKGSVFTMDDVEIPADSALVALRREQDARFRTSPSAQRNSLPPEGS